MDPRKLTINITCIAARLEQFQQLLNTRVILMRLPIQTFFTCTLSILGLKKQKQKTFDSSAAHKWCYVLSQHCYL